MIVADVSRAARHHGMMMSAAEFLATLERLKSEGTTTNAELSRVLGLPSSRVAEFFSGKRRITIDEMKTLVEHYGLEDTPRPPNAETIEPLLDAILPLAPAGRPSAESRRALAEALAYGLGLLGPGASIPASADALGVAARAAAARFRETALAS